MESVIEGFVWSHWFWWSLAGLLLILEILASGEFFLWPAIAALLTGFLAIVSSDWRVQLTGFAILMVAAAVIFIYRWRRFRRPAGHPTLNRRLKAMIGRSGQVRKPIPAGGTGEVKIGDSLWLATSRQPIGAETRVRVIGDREGVLVVEKAEMSPEM